MKRKNKQALAQKRSSIRERLHKKLLKKRSHQKTSRRQKTPEFTKHSPKTTERRLSLPSIPKSTETQSPSSDTVDEEFGWLEDAALKTSTVPASKLMTRFECRLRGGHFRFLNQRLYLSTGRQSLNLFKKQPDLFHQYHQGYLQSMHQWTIQPVDVATRWLRKQPSQQNVVDYGCGEARILKSKLPHNVTSLDLVALDPGVTVCDMTQTPLKDKSQDIAIFSLSLMGTDYHKCLRDAARILKMDGIIWIAEVCSRFADRSGKEVYQPFLEALGRLGFDRVMAKRPSKYFVVFVLKKRREFDRERQIQWPVLKPCLYKKR